MKLRLFAYLPFPLHFVRCVLHKWGAEPTPSPVDTVGSELHLETGALSVSPRADFPQSYDLGHVMLDDLYLTSTTQPLSFHLQTYWHCHPLANVNS